MNRRVATVLVDALFLLLLVLVVLPHEPDAEEETAVDLFAPLLVGARWPDGAYTDVDLWVRGPGDHPVGYSRHRGTYASLLRDDLGEMREDPAWRYELAAFSRFPDGEYVVNVHAYNDVGGRLPLDVRVDLWSRTPEEGYRHIWSGSARLTHLGQEVTVVRFRVSGGEPVPGSFNDVHTPLRIGDST